MLNHDPIEKVLAYTGLDQMAPVQALPQQSEWQARAQDMDARSKPKARIVYPSKSESVRLVPRI